MARIDDVQEKEPELAKPKLLRCPPVTSCYAFSLASLLLKLVNGGLQFVRTADSPHCVEIDPEYECRQAAGHDHVLRPGSEAPVCK